jgi:hypothetical protein
MGFKKVTYGTGDMKCIETKRIRKLLPYVRNFLFLHEYAFDLSLLAYNLMDKFLAKHYDALRIENMSPCNIPTT